MDNLKEFLGRTRVPDPGEEYWQALPGRISRRLDGEPSEGAQNARYRPVRGRLLPVAAAAAALLLLAVLSAVRFAPPAPERIPVEIPGRPVVLESERTAALARNDEAGGVLRILGKAAREKVNQALDAHRRGEDERLAPLVRSFEMIVRTGILQRIRKALDRNEDLSGSVGFLRESVLSVNVHWQRLARDLSDPESAGALQKAVEATRALSRVLDEQANGNERG
jgi:hypothetical protein